VGVVSTAWERTSRFFLDEDPVAIGAAVSAGPRAGGRQFWEGLYVRLAASCSLALVAGLLLLAITPDGAIRDSVYFIGGCLTLVLAGLALSCAAVAAASGWALAALLPVIWLIVGGLCVVLVLNP
jgi:hypothetical protein